MSIPVHVKDAIDNARTISRNGTGQVWIYPSQLDKVVSAIQPAIEYMQTLGQSINIHPHDIPMETVAKIEHSIMEMSVAPDRGPICRNNGGHTPCRKSPPGQEWCTLCKRRGKPC